MTQKQPRFPVKGTGAVWRELLLCQKNRAHFAPLESMKNLSDRENGKLAFLTSGCPAFREHAKCTEGSDTTPTSHTRACIQVTISTEVKKDHAARRGRDASGQRHAYAHRCPEAFCVLWEHPRPRPKSGKVRRSDTRPGDVCERAERSEGSDTTPSEMPPVSACGPLCAIFL